MDQLVQSSIKLVQSKQKASVPWKLDGPHDQPYYTYNTNNNGEWAVTKSLNREKPSSTSDSPHTLALYSWNIDFMLPYSDSRMSAAIRHIQSLIEQQPSETVTVIFFAECLESDLKVIAADSWVRNTFHMTDLNGTYWQSGHYGTTTLIDRRLPIERCFRVHYSQTRMERDGLFVDTKLNNDKIIRLCNTHLESLALEPAYRPPQMQMCAEYMHDASVSGAVLAGDLNAIQAFDKRLHSDNNLKDAYLELGGSEDDAEKGHTWGQQAATVQRKRFGTSRMDKVYFCGELECLSFKRFGADVQLEDERERKEIVALGFEKPWITDHLGIKAVFQPSS